MPRINKEEFLDQISQERTPIDDLVIKHKEKDHSLGSILEAAFKTENVVGSAITFGMDDRDITNRNYDPYTPLMERGRFDLLEGATWVDSDEELAEYIDRSDEKQEYQKILDESGWGGTLAAITAGTLDPTILIPGTGAIKATTKIGSIAKGFGAGAATGTIAAGGQEAILQQQQPGRPEEQIAYAGIAGAVLGGSLGGLLGALTTKDASQQLIKTILETTEEPKIRIDAKTPSSAGAMQVSPETRVGQLEADMKVEGLAGLNETVAKNVSGVFGKWSRSPLINGLTSQYLAMRQFTNSLFEHNFILGKNLQGKASVTPIESMIKIDQGNLTLKVDKIENLYYDYVGITGPAKGLRAQWKGRSPDTLNWKQFQEELDKALRNSDTHKIPQVEQAAKIIRQDLDDIKAKFQQLGMFADDVDVKGATSYFRRRYNIRAIQKDRNEFEQVLKNHFVRSGMAEAEAEREAVQTSRNILGQGDQAIQLSGLGIESVTGAGTFTKERVLDIPDNDIAKFLEKSAVDNYASYVSQASGIIRLQEGLNKAAYDNLADIKKTMRDEKEIRERVFRDAFDNGEITEKQMLKGVQALDKSLSEANKQVDDFASIITGRLGGPQNKMDKFLKNLRKFQTQRLLGGMTISALPDPAMPVFKNGILKTLKHGYMPLVRSIKASKMAKDEYKHFAVGLELMQNELLRVLTDGDFSKLSGKTRLDAIMDSTTDIFGKMTLNTYWTNMWKRQGAQVSSGRIFESIENFVKTGKIKDKEVTRLAQLGISKDDLPKIWEQFEKYGQKYKGSYISDFASWDNKALRDRFGAAILKEVDSTILTPGRGDIPVVFQSNQLLKTVFQFKSFTAAATNKILLSALQRRDANTLMGLTMLASLGTLSYAVKEAIAGRDHSDEGFDFWAGKFATEGIPRSGMAGLMGDATFALNPWIATGRYAGLNAQSYILGPSANMIGDTYSAVHGVTDGELTEADKRKLTRLLPYHNLFWLRVMMDKLDK